MPSVDSQAGTRAQQHFSTVHLNQDSQEPQTSKSQPSDTSTVISQRQDSDNTTQLSSYDIVRNDDRQRYAAGERPGPNWKDPEAMKAWLEHRFPQGTKAGSPYYQFMIAASGLEDTYWTPGRGSEEVVGKFSESEWKRWTKEKAGLVMHSKWGQDPLYPDVNTVMSQEAFGYTASSRPSSQPSTQQNHSQMADVDRFLGGIKLPAFLSRVEKHLDTNPYDREKGHSPSKRTADDAELDAQEPPPWKKYRNSRNPATLSQMMQSIPEKDSSSKKRTASDAETDADESPCAKRVKRFSGTTSPFQTAKPNLNSRNTRRDRTIKQFRHAPLSTLSPPEDREAEKVGHDSLSSFRSFGSHDDVVAEYIQRSMLIGQEEKAAAEEETEEEDEEETAEEAEEAEVEVEDEEEAEEAAEKTEGDEHGHEEDEAAAILSNTEPSLTQKPPQAAQTSTSTTPHATKPQPPFQHLIRVLIPAPQTPKTPPKKHKQQRQSPKKRRPTSLSPPCQTRYTTHRLRSGVGKRRHTLPCFVHLGMKGRKEVQISSCFGF